MRRSSSRPPLVVVAAAVLFLAACGESSSPVGDGAGPRATIEDRPSPPIAVAELDPEVDHALDLLIDRVRYEGPNAAVDVVEATGDARLAWMIADVLRFAWDPALAERLTTAYATLTGVEVDPERPWSSAVDQLMIWDIPAPPSYFEKKRRLFTSVDERWAPLFDPSADIDWRFVGWGGVFIDDRPLGELDNCFRGCIPALDDPPVSDATGGDWYPDDAVVFGVEIEGEYRAYPKNIMEIHEMVNDTVGGRRIGLPYCTLCGSAQVYFTDRVDGRPLDDPFVLRTSGLLIRSNKMMYELASGSYIDTFTGEAITGELRDNRVVLEQASVVTATWGEWRAAHPETTIVTADAGRGRTYPLDPLQGRDDDGPIFPIGSVDPRLDEQEPVLGVIGRSGRAVAFPVREVRAALDRAETVSLDGIDVVEDADGLRARRSDGGDASGHQAFWFAWSQFHPDTLLWSG